MIRTATPLPPVRLSRATDGWELAIGHARPRFATAAEAIEVARLLVPRPALIVESDALDDLSEEAGGRWATPF